jgi:UPF0176 protein
MQKNTYQVLLYYKYVALPDPESVMNMQKILCTKLHLKGRIIVAKEGINGTIEGTAKETNQYMKEMEQIEAFKDIHYKKSKGTGNAFPKLSVKVREEIVSSNVPYVNPAVLTGKYLSSEELHTWFKEKKEFYIVDMRNEYEYRSGFFEGTIFSGFNNFRDLPSITEKLKDLKHKTIVTVCTGGVRCEKASGFLVLNGFKDVYQLQDGIQTYMETYPNEEFKGKLYVFDNRLTIGFHIDNEKHEIVGKCLLCGKSEDAYVNCMNPTCHLHFICCKDCLDPQSGLAFCSEICKKIVASIKQENIQKEVDHA